MKKNDIIYSVLLIFLIIPFLPPASYVFNENIINGFSLWLMINCIIIILIYLMYSYKQKNFSIGTLLFCVFQFFYLFPTFIYGTKSNIITCCSICIANVSIYLLTDMFLHKNPKIFLKNVSIVFGILILIHFTTIFLYPNGMHIDILGDNNFYFLGHDNGSFFYVLPVIFCMILYTFIYARKKIIFCLMFLLLSIFVFFKVWSVLALCMLILLLIVIIFKNNIIIKKICNIKILMWILIIFFFAIVIFKIQNMFSYLLLNIFNKDMTLSGRTRIWDLAVEYIKDNPILGYGIESQSVSILKFGISHIHNIVLQIIYNCGFVGFGIYIIYIKNILKSFKKNKKSSIYVLFSIVLFIYLFSSMLDFYNDKYIISILLCLFANIKILAEENNKQNNGDKYD